MLYKWEISLPPFSFPCWQVEYLCLPGTSRQLYAHWPWCAEALCYDQSAKKSLFFLEKSILMAFLLQTVALISFFFPPRLWQWGFPSGVSGKEPACQCRKCKRHGFSPWVRKILWKRTWQPTPVFLPGEIPWIEEPGGLQSKGFQRVRHNWNGMAQHWLWQNKYHSLRTFYWFLVGDEKSFYFNGWVYFSSP